MTALRQALIDLGYKDCYHFTALTSENPPDAKMRIEAIQAKFLGKGKPFTREDWDKLLGHCQAVTDTPCVVFYKELLETYPEAKVIVTTRDSVDQWHYSMVNTIMPFIMGFVKAPANPLKRALQYFTPADSGTYLLSKLMVENFPMFRALWFDIENNAETGKDWYRGFMKELKETIPREKLLVMNIKEGWEPICSFLGHEVPLYPFPRKNDMAAFQRNSNILGMAMQRAALWEMVKTVGGVTLGLLAVAVGLAKVKGWVW